MTGLKTIACFCIFMVVAIVIFPSPSSKNFAHYFPIERQQSASIQGRRLGNGYGAFSSSSSSAALSSSDSALKDSAREVPTGPDPLHHKSNPWGH